MIRFWIYSKEEQIGFNERLNMGIERKEGIKDNSIFGPEQLVPFIGKRSTGEGARWEAFRNQEFYFKYVNLRCLLDIQMDMSSRQLDKLIWHSGE